MRKGIVDWIFIAGIIGSFVGGWFSPESIKADISESVGVDYNRTCEPAYPKIILND